MAVEFYKLDEDLPLDDFLLLPTKAFISYGHSSVPKVIQTVQKVFNSKRYVPEMLRGLGVSIDDSLAFSNGDSLTSFYYESKAGGVTDKSLENKLKTRLNLQENQISFHTTCFVINFNANHSGHGWLQSIKKPHDEESWPPQWFKKAASFLLPTCQDAIMASNSAELSIRNSSSVLNVSSPSPTRTFNNETSQDEMESSITNQDSTASSLQQSFHNNSHDDIDSSIVLNQNMESSLLQLDSNTNVADESTEITSTTTSALSSMPGDSLACGMNTPRPDNAKQEKIDKESYVPEKLQMPLVSFKPTLSKKTVKTRKGQQLQWTGNTMEKHGNIRSNNKKELLSFLHTISGGDQQRAALILEGVIKEIPVAKEKLLKNTIDTDIVASISDTVKSFGS